MPLRYFGKRGELRIQSGKGLSASSNHFFTVTFINMDFSGPMDRGNPDEIPVLDRGVLTSTTHYIQGPDDVVMAPLTITFTADLDDTANRNDLYDALGNPSGTSNGHWTVGGLSFANANGQSQIYNGSGTLVSTPVPFSIRHNRVDFVMLWRGGTPGTNDEGWAYREVYCAPRDIRITEGQDAVRLAVTGQCYGPASHITAFSAGSAV